jgi:hypothetical protein
MSAVPESLTPARHAYMGADVWVTRDPHANNGADISPAKICRAWSDTSVNLRVFGDGVDCAWMTTVPLFETREALDAWRARHAEQWHEVSPNEPVPVAHGAYWPPRREDWT